MNAKMIVTLLGVLSVGVSAGSCSAGWKLKGALTGLKCTSAMASAAACTAKCCEKDTTKCGGKTVACAAGKYEDPTKAGMAGGADAAAEKIACCTDKATCAAATCAAGTKAMTSASATKCSSNAASCDQATCCENDTTKCGAIAVVCASGKYKDAMKAGMAGGADAAAQKIACCTAKSTCAAATCAAGMKANTTAASKMCASHAASCSAGACCESDTTKCGGQTPKIACDSTHIAKAADTVGTTKAQCCMTTPEIPAMATCAAFKAPPATAGAQETAMSLLFAVAGVVALWK